MSVFTFVLSFVAAAIGGLIGLFIVGRRKSFGPIFKSRSDTSKRFEAALIMFFSFLATIALVQDIGVMTGLGWELYPDSKLDTKYGFCLGVTLIIFLRKPIEKKAKAEEPIEVA